MSIAIAPQFLEKKWGVVDSRKYSISTLPFPPFPEGSQDPLPYLRRQQ